MLFSNIRRGIAGQRGTLMCWAPIFLAFGIGGYFSLNVEPVAGLYLWAGCVVAVLGLGARWLAEDWRPLLAALLLVLIGGMLAGMRAHRVAEPVLGFRYYGPIEGRIVKIDRSQSDAVRLTLDRVVLKRMSPLKTPSFVRVSLHGQQGFIEPEPGLTVILTGHLSPPSGPVEPGGFDFQRQAWFQGLGAVGYTRTPVLAFAAAEKGGLALRLYRLRMSISAWVQGEMPGPAGAFAAAVMTGDRSGMDADVVEDLRASNLSHLLAISGLHMGLLTGFIFSIVRYIFAAIPPLALRWPTKKIAATVALVVGAGYLALSGGNVATERAFIMVAVMFVAVLLDRRAVTLRAVAVAAVIVLVLRPEVLPQPGFQMSFAATTALVAVFGVLRKWRGPVLPKAMRPVMAVLISSAVAGLATAPVAAAHFNRIADFGLLANLLSVPLMGLIVMPGAVLTAVLAPLGLAWIGLAMMRPAIEWILGVAHWVAGLDGALTHVPSPGGYVLPLIALGILWAVLWQGRRLVRVVGIVPVLAGFTLWASVERPAVLISDTGGLVGVLGDQGRVLSKPKGSGFAAKSWLENDGDGVEQADAFARAGFGGTKGALEFRIAGQGFVHLSGRGSSERVAQACAQAAIVIVTAKVDADDFPCQVFDPKRLRQTGALAFIVTDGDLEMVSAREVAGQRLWNSRDIRKQAQDMRLSELSDIILAWKSAAQ